MSMAVAGDSPITLVETDSATAVPTPRLEACPQLPDLTTTAARRNAADGSTDLLASADWETDGGRVLVDLAEISGDVLARATACRSRKTRGCA